MGRELWWDNAVKKELSYSFVYKCLWHLFPLEDDFILMLVWGKNLSLLQTGLGTNNWDLNWVPGHLQSGSSPSHSLQCISHWRDLLYRAPEVRLFYTRMKWCANLYQEVIRISVRNHVQGSAQTAWWGLGGLDLSSYSWMDYGATYTAGVSKSFLGR